MISYPNLQMISCTLIYRSLQDSPHLKVCVHEICVKTIQCLSTLAVFVKV